MEKVSWRSFRVRAGLYWSVPSADYGVQSNRDIALTDRRQIKGGKLERCIEWAESSLEVSPAPETRMAGHVKL
jgi:hypothetical protein